MKRKKKYGVTEEGERGVVEFTFYRSSHTHCFRNLLLLLLLLSSSSSSSSSFPLLHFNGPTAGFGL
jgi:hypothetical protein